MTKMYLVVLMWSAMLMNATVSMAEPASQVAMDRAEAITETYLAALLQGDVQSMKAVMGGRFLAKKEMVLDSSDYSVRLLEAYSGASYELTRSLSAGVEKTAVDARLNMADGNLLDTRFIVSRLTDSVSGQVRYLITDEIY